MGDPALRMSRAEYHAWANNNTGRYERLSGVVVAMAPERAAHNRTKARVFDALREAIKRAGAPCEAFTDGMAVPVGEEHDYEPDALVRCGELLSPDAVAVTDPLIIVEILSPNTARHDRTAKLDAYFRLPTVMHYLIVWPDRPQIVHYHRDRDQTIVERTYVAGMIELDPPGITIAVEAVCA
jgi:Uma2 family endonuclease